ncbi:DUF6783 domain-containing protein [Ruminococcus sp. 2227st1_E6_2227SCRN_220401]|uniref:DUF6783 domain-containing protein n=1 Tax=unclassified Ruminococcus TaxID=2608920 RepID=UPI00319D9914
MCVTICGRFRSDEGAVAGYGNRIRVKSPAKWGVQIAGMIFQTRSRIHIIFNRSCCKCMSECMRTKFFNIKAIRSHFSNYIMY